MSSKFFEALQKYVGTRGLSLNEDKVKEDLNENDSHNRSDSQLIKAADDSERITTEIVMQPNVPDAHGHWYTEETIRKGQASADRAWKEGRLKMNLFHEYDDTDCSNLELLSHSVTDFDCMVGNQLVKEGTWVARVKWHNEELYKSRTQIKEDGLPDVAGLSPKCRGVVNPPKKIKEDTLNE